MSMSGLISNVIGAVIELIIATALAPAWFSNLICETENDAYKIFFRLIYPKWLSFKQKIKYNVIIRRHFRHIRYERKRLIIGVMIRN